MILWLHPFLKLDELVSWTTSKSLYPSPSALHILLPLMPWYRKYCVFRCFWDCECVNTLIFLLALQEWGYIRMNSSWNYMPRSLWLAQTWHAGFWGVGGREGTWEPLELQVWQKELAIYADNRRCKYASISTKKCMTVKSEKAKFLEK